MKTTLAILAIGAALLGGARLLHRPIPATPPTPRLVGRPVVLGGSLSRTRRTPTASAPAEPEPRQQPTSAPLPATQTARRFMMAFLAWQQGGRDRATLTALRATSSRALWRGLNHGASRPGANRAIPTERLHRLASGAANTPAAATVLAELQRRHSLGGLALVLRHQPDGWRVTSLTR